jgi:Mce-associated membrane protein
VTVLLVAVTAMLTALLVVEIRVLEQIETDDGGPGRPVAVGEATHGAAVGAAAASTRQALSYGFEDFDAQVDAATEEMTDAFAEEFRRTTAEARDRFVAERTTQEVRVVGAAVVSATETRVSALLFLDQYVAKAGSDPTVMPYRALATVVRDDGRWLLEDIETR